MAPFLELVDIHKTYGHGRAARPALRGVSLTVEPGRFVAVMGPSGSGKSTMLHVAAGLEPPDRGAVALDGQVVGAADRRRWAEIRRRDLGLVFQRLNLVPTLTVGENVGLPVALDGRRSRRVAAAARDALQLVQLDGAIDRFPSELSGGEQQRVALARAVVGERRLVLADEPTGALDSVSGELVLSVLADLAAHAGVAVVMVTHDSRQASWADEVVFIRDGAIVDRTGGATDVPVHHATRSNAATPTEGSRR